MGAGSSVQDKKTALQFATFIKLKDLYETEYEPKIASGELKEGDVAALLNAKYDELIEVALTRREEIKTKGQAMVNVINVGDVVTTQVGGNEVEGVCIALHYEDHHVTVDDGNDTHEVLLENVTVKLKGESLEVNDKVEIKDPEGSALFYHGTITTIDAETGKVDIKMDGDDPDDYERGVAPENVRKVQTGRNLACMRWNKATTTIKVMRAFVMSGKHAKHPLQQVLSAHSTSLLDGMEDGQEIPSSTEAADAPAEG